MALGPFCNSYDLPHVGDRDFLDGHALTCGAVHQPIAGVLCTIPTAARNAGRPTAHASPFASQTLVSLARHSPAHTSDTTRTSLEASMPRGCPSPFSSAYLFPRAPFKSFASRIPALANDERDSHCDCPTIGADQSHSAPFSIHGRPNFWTVQVIERLSPHFRALILLSNSVEKRLRRLSRLRTLFVA